MENDEMIIVSIILKNGVNLIGELVYADDHTISIERPIEIIKRPAPTNSGYNEVITTSPFLIMVSDPIASIQRSDILCANAYHQDLYNMYQKMADRYYINVADILTEGESVTGTIH